MRGLRWRMRKEPKPRISILSPPLSAPITESKMVSTMTSPSRRVRSPTRSPFPPGLPLSCPLGLRSQHNRIRPILARKRRLSCGIEPFPCSIVGENARAGDCPANFRPRRYDVLSLSLKISRAESAQDLGREGNVTTKSKATPGQERAAEVQHRDSGLQRERPHSGDAPVGGGLHPRPRLGCRGHRGQRRLHRRDRRGGARLCPNAPEVRLIENPGNRGKGYSVRSGMLQARGEVVMFTDSDLSAPIEEAERLFAAIAAGRGHRHRLPLAGERPPDPAPAALPAVLRPLLQRRHPHRDGAALCRYAVRLQGLHPRRRPDRLPASDHRALGLRPGDSLFIALKRGFWIIEVPVSWAHDERSRMSYLRTA
jgi:hypothetical protein